MIVFLSLAMSHFKTEYLLLGATLILIAYLLLLVKEKDKKVKKLITMIFFVLYCIFLISTILYTKIFTEPVYDELGITYNIIPLTSIANTLYLTISGAQGFYNVFYYLILDIILFIPLGLRLPLIFPKK